MQNLHEPFRRHINENSVHEGPLVGAVCALERKGEED